MMIVPVIQQQCSLYLSNKLPFETIMHRRSSFVDSLCWLKNPSCTWIRRQLKAREKSLWFGLVPMGNCPKRKRPSPNRLQKKNVVTLAVRQQIALWENVDETEHVRMAYPYPNFS